MGVIVNMDTHNEHAINRAWAGRGKLSDLVTELERQKNSKVDFVADTRSLRVVADGGELKLAAADSRAGEWIGKDSLTISENALQQVGAKQEPPVPGQFLNALAGLRTQRAADLLQGLMQDGPARRFVRCMDGRVRAFLSDRFRVLDHYDIAFAALDAARALGGEVIEASLSETNMRIKITSRSVFQALDERRTSERGNWYAGGLGNQEFLGRVGARTGGELPGGPGTVHPVVTISNSETGHGGFGVRIGLLRAICFNLSTVEDVVARVHLGERQDVGLYSEATISQESKALYMKARDAVGAAFRPEVFGRIVDNCRAAQGREIKAPQAAVSNIAKLYSMSDKARDAVLAYFLRDNEPTNYGLGQAVARAAQDEQEPEAAAAMEDIAGKLITSRAELVPAGV